MRMLVKDIITEYSVRNKEGKAYPVYSVTNSQGFCKDYFGKEVASKDKSSYKIVPYGYFAYNPSRINVGSIDWQHCEDNVIVSPLYNVFKVNTSIAKQEYLSYYFKSRLVSDFINTFAKGTVRLNVPISTLGDFPIPVPPLSEQQRIVSELDLLSCIIEKKKAQQKEYDQLAQSIFYDMFGDPVTNEKGWEVVKLGELTEVGTGSTPDRKNESYYLGNNPWIKSTEVCNCAIYDVQEHISDDALKDTNCTLYPENTILIAMYGQGKTRGQVAIMKLEACTNQAVAAILPSSKIEPMFLYQHLHLMYEHIRSLARGGNQSNLNLSLVKSIKIMVPPLHLQQSFASKIEAIERQKALIQQSIAEVQMLFDSRMDDWFA